MELVATNVLFRTLFCVLVVIIEIKGHPQNPYQNYENFDYNRNYQPVPPPQNPFPPRDYTPNYNPPLPQPPFNYDPIPYGPPYTVDNHGPQPPSTVHYDVFSTRPTTGQDSILPGGLVDRQIVLNKQSSPYILREDLIIGKNGELVVEPGVIVKFAPMIGITVRGVARIKGTNEERIIFTSTSQPAESLPVPKIRLVDGPTILTGRVQIYHKEKWRSVCTNSRNWTRADLETACRQLGFQGGEWWAWMDREPGPSQPRLLYEEPKCYGTESSIMDCQWSSRQLGSGVCDFHPDLAISCSSTHSGPNLSQYWRGLRFEGALFEKRLTQQNTLYVPTSRSILEYIDILYAGSGRSYNTTSAVDVEGVPPIMKNVAVLYSAYNGINITRPEAPVHIVNSTIQNNRGYGVFVNTSVGGVFIERSFIEGNGADGIRYVHYDPRLDDKLDRTDIYDFCMFPTTSSQTFPVAVMMEQGKYLPTEKECSKYFSTKQDQVLTFEIVSIMTDRNDSAVLEIRDGASPNDRLIATLSIRNNTRPQSITTTRSSLFVRFRADPLVQVLVLVRLTSGYSKKYDLHVATSNIGSNNGRGVAVEELRSCVHIDQTSISANNYIAGLHVFRGSGDVNITDSRIAFNIGDGVNISYTGGSRNITRSVLSSNQGFGVAVWLNDTTNPEFISVFQESAISYSEIFKNEFGGLFFGNFCDYSIINVTGNWFNHSLGNAIEIQSCWRNKVNLTLVQIGHNKFTKNEKLGVKIVPALNMMGRIEFNHFTENVFGSVLIKNPSRYEEQFEFDVLQTELLIQFNEFQFNRGSYVVNIGVSPYSDMQFILFTRNFVRYNKITEPFDQGEGYEDEGKVRLIPRSRVAAPVVVSSSNVDIYRNIIQNHESRYEIGSHLEDQSKTINCTFNWLGYSEEKKIFFRLFHRKDRYNLAKIIYIPYLLHSSNPATSTIVINPIFVPQFWIPGTNTLGGEVDGIESIPPGEYYVERDINVRPGGRLNIQSGVTLRFPPSVGLMVAGRLEARGRGPNDILMTLKQERIEDNNELNVTTPTRDPPVRLLGGRSYSEGRLQVKVNNTWGTVCNYRWNVVNAALVCHQLGLVLDPSDWFLERSEIPLAGTSEPVIISNVQCTRQDTDITKCRAETSADFENSCSHDSDVGVRCHEPVWAGVRFSVLSEPSTLQFITIEKSGLLDYSTNKLKPALQLDLARHSLENVKISSNSHDGLGIIYSDLYSSGASNAIRNSEFSNNRGSGISFKQLGLSVSSSTLENNQQAGIRHNPVITSQDQKELAGWFGETDLNMFSPIYNPIYIPQTSNFDLDTTESKYLISQRVTHDPIDRTFTVRARPGYVIGIQLLNPIHNRSTETIIVYDSQSVVDYSERWDLRRDLTVFPSTSSSYSITLKYSSGQHALGGCVLLLSSVPAPIQNIPNRVVRGAVPTLSLSNTAIKRNFRGIWVSYYNRHLDEKGDHYLRKANESVKIISCDISHNFGEAIFVDSPFWNVFRSNISEITVEMNSSLVTDNGRGIYQFSKDLRQSNDLFHWTLYDNSIERNTYGGFEVTLPYVWQYNENFTHTLRFQNNTFRNNQQFAFIVDGHFAAINMSKNVFSNNNCKNGLISIRGMEKRMKIEWNDIIQNSGAYMIEFRADSQSEIMGRVDAIFRYNRVKQNKPENFLRVKNFQHAYRTPSCVVGFHGIQDVRVNQNLFGENTMDYELISGIRTAKLDTFVDVSENWWGTNDVNIIKEKIFDFDDWNNHAISKFRPYLMDDQFDGSLSVSWETPSILDIDSLGGRIKDNLVLYQRPEPYIVRSDITILPEATMSIAPGVVMEFTPNVGILVLGTLRAQGARGYEIIMRPHGISAPMLRQTRSNLYTESIRLCPGVNCTKGNQGFLEYYNKTTMQWVPVCDDRFTERNAQVVCKELGYDPINVRFDQGPRVEFHPNSLSRIWSYPEPLQCLGTEDRLEDCPVRLNGQQYDHIHRCEWNSDFVFIHCGERNLPKTMQYWGGIRFANSEFEQNLYEHRLHDVVTHETGRRTESIMEYVNITGAGILHNEKSPAVQAVTRSPQLNNLNITLCAQDGVNLISPSEHIRLLFNNFQNNLGTAISVVSLTGEGRESEESSFTPLRESVLPYHVFSLVDMCDTTKEIIVEERVLLYFKYDNVPVNCVKIFRSVYSVKPFGFRLLQFNLYNSTSKPGRADSLTLYDGSIYNVSAPEIATIEVGSPLEKKLIRTTRPSLSVRLFANGASSVHGFIAEVVTLPISAMAFNRDVQHNISYSVLSQNERGAVVYQSAGEVNPTVTIEWNQLTKNCEHVYGNFTSCEAAVHMDLQNTQNVYFRNNLLRHNQGGLYIRADSRGSATAMKAYLFNNLWTENWNRPALHVEGRQSSTYQEVTVYRNYFTKNYAPYRDIVVLRQVFSNFSFNYLHENKGLHILEVSGFEKVRLQYYQVTSHNGFYWNYALERDTKSTIVAGTAGQHYVDNVLFNPDNDYEIVTVNRTRAGINSTHDVWKTPIDAKHNWWGYNETLAVTGRIKDRTDDPDLLEVDFKPYLLNNRSILSGKCPPGWTQVGDTCYIYVGAPMTFEDAREFCRSDNASMPYIVGEYLELYNFLRKHQERYQYYDRVWVQHIDRINQCTVFTFQTIERDNCQRLNPFLCEIDPKVHINALNWREDVVTVAILGVGAAMLLIIALIVAFWYTKSRKRRLQRLERRNSIRQSLRSLKSIGSNPNFSDLGYRNKVSQSPNLNREYKKMNGSLDSMDKSQFTSSVDDNQSFEAYETHNPYPNVQTPTQWDDVTLTYQNKGFRDNSTYPSKETFSIYEANTLPLSGSIATDSILDLKRSPETDTSSGNYRLPYTPSTFRDYYSHTPTTERTELKTPNSEMAEDLFYVNPPSMQTYNDYNNSVIELPREENAALSHLLNKSKSEALLETNFEFDDSPDDNEAHALTNKSRSKSQPLETAM